MEEKNEYLINIDELEIILNKTNIHLSDKEKYKVIEIINSGSVNNTITDCDLDYSKKIIVLRLYLEWRSHIIDNVFKNNNIEKPNKMTKISEKIKEIKARNLNIINQDDLKKEEKSEKNTCEKTIEKIKNKYLFEKEEESKNNETFMNSLENERDYTSQNNETCFESFEENNKTENIKISIQNIENNRNNLFEKSNNDTMKSNEIDINNHFKDSLIRVKNKYLLKKEENKNEHIQYNNENISTLHVKDDLLDARFKILKMRLEMINILKYDNDAISKEIEDHRKIYKDNTESIEIYRKKVDREVLEERVDYDLYYEGKYKNIIQPLIKKYIDNTNYIREYINETIDFYEKNINYNNQHDNISKLEYDEGNSLLNKDYDNPEKQFETINNIEDRLYKNYDKYKVGVDKNYDKYNVDIGKNLKGDDSTHLDKKIMLKNMFQKLRQNTKDYDDNEIKYFQKLTEERKNNINDLEKKIKEINSDDIPIRFQVLEKKLSIENKAMIINKLNEYKKNKYLSDSSKYFSWLHGLLKIPFGEYIKLPISSNNTNEEIKNYLEGSKKILDSAVYGHEETKENIIQLIAQWISNPESSGNVIGIQGPMGNGKTTLVKNGIAKAIQRPFEFISLGGSSDSAYLNGHSYTYEGATWGQIINVLINSKCMNPVFYFDELDKVSNTAKGEEITNLLIHITDATQNTKFQDRYFSGIDIDLSKAVFIFSYNEIDKINPILLDRLIQIKTSGFEVKDKINIFKQFLYKNISNNLGIKQEISFSDEIIRMMIEKYTEESGVRHLNKIIYAILSKINLSILTQSNEYEDKDGNIIINEKIIKEILKDRDNVNSILHAMYI